MDNLRSSTKDDSESARASEVYSTTFNRGPLAETHVHPFLIERLPEFPFEVDVQQARERQRIRQSYTKSQSYDPDVSSPRLAETNVERGKTRHLQGCCID